MGLGTQALRVFSVYWPYKFSLTISVHFLPCTANSGRQFCFYYPQKSLDVSTDSGSVATRLQTPLPALSPCLISAASPEHLSSWSSAGLCFEPAPSAVLEEVSEAESMIPSPAQYMGLPKPTDYFWNHSDSGMRIYSSFFLITDTTVTFPFNTCLPIPTVLLCPEHHDLLWSEILEEDTELLSAGVY